MTRLLSLLLLVLLAVLQQRLWIGPGGLTEVRHLREEGQRKQERIGRLEERNTRLAAEVHDLKNGLETVEEYARNRLGLIRPGEIYYQVPEPPPATHPD